MVSSGGVVQEIPINFHWVVLYILLYSEALIGYLPKKSLEDKGRVGGDMTA